MVRFSLYDQIPFTCSLGIMPFMAGLIIFYQYEIDTAFSQMRLMWTVFGSAFASIILVYICKVREDQKNPVEKQKKLKESARTTKIVLERTIEKYFDTVDLLKESIKKSSKELFNEPVIEPIKSQWEKDEDESRTKLIKINNEYGKKLDQFIHEPTTQNLTACKKDREDLKENVRQYKDLIDQISTLGEENKPYQLRLSLFDEEMKMLKDRLDDFIIRLEQSQKDLDEQAFEEQEKDAPKSPEDLRKELSLVSNKQIKLIKDEIKIHKVQFENLEGMINSILGFKVETARDVTELRTRVRNLLDEIDKHKTDEGKKKYSRLKTKLEKIMDSNYKKQIKVLKKFGIYYKSDEKKNKFGKQFAIFGVVYAIVGGLAITASLEAFVDPDLNPSVLYVHNILGILDVINSKPGLLIAAYFPLAIVFIHYGLIFLTTDASKMLAKGSMPVFFVSSLLMFLESVCLFYAGSSIGNILNFTFWILVLMVTDLVFVILNTVTAFDQDPQWLHLDLIMISFLVAILFLFPSLTQIEIEVYYLVLVIFLTKTVVDYMIGWKNFWGVFDVSDNALG